MIASATTAQARAREELLWFLRQSRARKLRSMREFAETEIVIPEGPYANHKFRCSVQPWTRLWFEAVDSGSFNRFVATGPTQTGKTLACYVIPTMFHLFEIGENVVCGVPKMEIAYDKWEQDFLPAVQKSRYRDLLPVRGKGSRGGTFESITFRNGATLKFMTGGGDDKNRAAFTSRVVVVTETDGFDEAAEKSREADPIKQLEARTRAYGHRKRVYLECTVSTEKGKIWQEYIGGTESGIVLQCPHCSLWVRPERQHFLGWEVATTEIDAERRGQFFCPECGTGWSEEQRKAANESARLVHRGRAIGEDGAVTGQAPETRTLSFRWSAVNNLFTTTAELGAEEWRSKHEADEENARKERDQFVWVVPHKPNAQDRSELSIDSLINRQGTLAKGLLPVDLQAVTAGIDVGKWTLHWTAKAWSGAPTGYTIDYGVKAVHSRDLGEELAILTALRELREMFLAGWKHTDKAKAPDAVFVDSGYWPRAVYTFCLESGPPFYPTKGFGATQYGQPHYARPRQTGTKVRFIGNDYHVARVTEDGITVDLVEIDADAWKSRVHSRLECDPEKPGAILLFEAPAREHLSYAKHLTAEKKVEEFIAGKGLQTRWVKARKDNHWLDTESLANVAADYCGVQVVKADSLQLALREREQRPQRARSTPRMPDGRPFLISQR
ncbi:hypothetical protein AYO47_00180 [Planctomyces sp. SCGC AG-212-M04]|nr:hypothetical protein AYO47_00180 [Planctomyces sp. SCGC AG-212-M04]